MKQMKKLVSVLLALVMVFTLGISAFAANTNSHTITITNEKSGHIYTAYQVFKGDIETKPGATTNEKVLTNIDWGSGVNGADVLTALQADMENFQVQDKNEDGSLKVDESNKPVMVNAFKDCKTAEDVANVLVSFSNSSQQLDAFAKIVGAHLSTAAGTSTKSPSGTYEISVTGDGYYFIKDTGTIGTDDAATKYILKVVENVTVAAKAETPAIDKVIKNADSDKDENPADDNTDGKGTAVDVGSVVTFKLTSKVPAMDGYDSYTYIVNDTMSNGLTAVDADEDGKIDVNITIGDAPYTDFTVAQDGQSFTITFNNFINQKDKAGKDIIITYAATLNKNALTTNRETNTVNLEYSNNPNDNTSKGKTPENIVYVYDFDIVVDKYTGDESSGTRLAGAMFVLKNSEGKYYYQDATTKTVTWKTVNKEPDITNMTAEEIKAAWETLDVTVITTDTNGAAKFQGVDAGTYYLKEVAAPAGYNLLKDDVPVTITATYGKDGQITSSTATSTSNGQYQQTEKVKNNAGAQLPETGGMGTTLFYVVGSVLVIGAAVLLITKKRMSKNR